MDLSNKYVIHVKKQNIEYLQFRKLLEYSEDISHAFVIGLDKSFRTGKRKEETLDKKEYDLAVKSYNEICDELDLKYNNIVKGFQMHSANVKTIYEKTNTDEPDFYSNNDTDGLITNKKDLVLSTTSADCILFLFYDPIKKVIANVHSGWRGTVQRISVVAVEKMKEEFNCNPEDIICCICPSIRKCHFEVDRDVYEIFNNELQDLDNNLDEIIVKRDNKWLIDTVLINQIILERAGLKKENIIDSKICTVCNKELIHSYRVEREGFGISTAIIALK